MYYGFSAQFALDFINRNSQCWPALKNESVGTEHPEQTDWSSGFIGLNIRPIDAARAWREFYGDEWDDATAVERIQREYPGFFFPTSIKAYTRKGADFTYEEAIRIHGHYYGKNIGFPNKFGWPAEVRSLMTNRNMDINRMEQWGWDYDLIASFGDVVDTIEQVAIYREAMNGIPYRHRAEDGFREKLGGMVRKGMSPDMIVSWMNR